ncbi:TPA: hypothetical protein ACH3X3_001990 [Trebouxia sp. C0006]
MMQLQVFSVRNTCRTHQARATTAVRCKFELITCMPCSLALLSQRTAARAVRLMGNARSCTYLRHCEDRSVYVIKTAPGRLRSRSRSAYKFATRSKREATPEILVQGTRWKLKLPWFLSILFAVGAVLGPALDGIHGTVHLLTYDSGQFDMADTKQGLALAVLCACAAPASELIIMNVFGLWHYPHPNVFQEFGRGLPGWVSACYFFYTPAVGNTARLIWKRI